MLEFLFLISLFLIKFVPFYYFPLVSRVFSSHTLAKLILLLIFFFILFKKYSVVNNLFNKNKKNLVFILLYFITMSLSIVHANSIVFYWKNFHNIIVNVIVFLLSFLIISINVNILSKIKALIIISGCALIILELLFLFSTHTMLSFLNIFTQREVLDAYLTDLSRDRRTLSLQLEIFIPFYIFGIYNLLRTRQKKIERLFYFLLISIVFFVNFTSNYRSRVLNSLFGAIISLLIIKNIKIAIKYKNLIRSLIKKFLITIFLSFLLGLFISNFLYRFNIMDRFRLNDDFGGKTSIVSRFVSWQVSVDLFRSSPLVGVGLGNYFNPLNKKSPSLNQQDYIKRFNETSNQSPHNIFFQILGESGLLGIISFLLLIGHFVYRDYKIIKSNFIPLFPFIVSSWVIFIFFNVEPYASAYVSGWFWFFRGVLETANN